MSEQDRTRILVAGLGSIGRRHARLISERGDTELSLCDLNEQFIEETCADLHRPASECFQDFGEALAARPDLVFVCTPNHLHVPMGIQAVEAGCDVMVEKPISDRVESARELVAAAEEAGRFLHVGYMLRFDRGLNRLRKLVDEGCVGALVSGRAMVGSYFTLLCARTLDRLNQPYNIVVDCSHEFDFIRWLFGDAEQATATATCLGDRELRPTHNLVQMILTMASGALVQVHMDYLQHPQRRTFEIYGDKGVLTYDMQTGEIRRFEYEEQHRFEMLGVGDVPERRDHWYRDQLGAVLKCRAAGEPPPVSGQDGLRALAIAQAVIDSAEQGGQPMQVAT